MALGALLTKAVFGAMDYWRQGPAKLTDPIIASWLGTGNAVTGKAVTIDAALQVSTVWACVGLIAETVATLPCNVYESGDNGRTIAKQHPLYTLLHDAPNADQTAVEFWEQMVAFLLLYGNAYARIDRVGGGGGRLGVPVSLTPMLPQRMTVRRNADGAPEYIYNHLTGGPETLNEDGILHIRGFSLDGLLGLSPVSRAANSIGLSIAAEETAGALFKNGMRTSGYVEAPQVLTETQRKLSEALLARFIGTQNAGKVPLLEGGFKYHAMTMPAHDAELLASRAFAVEELCRWYRVPPFMVGHTEKSTSWGSGLEQQMIGFQTLTLRPWLKRIEMAVKRRLLSPGERGRIEVEFNVAGLLRGDSAARAAYYTAMVTNGIYSRDEVRDLENMRRRGGMADSLTIQSQNVPIDVAGASLAPPAPAAPSPAPQQGTPA